MTESTAVHSGFWQLDQLDCLCYTHSAYFPQLTSEKTSENSVFVIKSRIFLLIFTSDTLNRHSF
jgi:hypothetical protein